jgi:hypothetical protein
MKGRALALAGSRHVNLPTPQDLALAQDLKYKKLKVQPSSSIFRKLSSAQQAAVQISISD